MVQVAWIQARTWANEGQGDLRLRHRHRDPRGGRRRSPAHPHTEDDLRYARRRYLTVEACRQAARIIANATFTSRQTALWGEGTTAVASDSTHFSAFDQNIFTEWHSRYRVPVTTDP